MNLCQQVVCFIYFINVIFALIVKCPNIDPNKNNSPNNSPTDSPSNSHTNDSDQPLGNLYTSFAVAFKVAIDICSNQLRQYFNMQAITTHFTLETLTFYA